MDFLERAIAETFEALAAELAGFVRGKETLSRSVEDVVTWIGVERGRFNTTLSASFRLTVAWFDVADPRKTRVWTRKKLFTAGVPLRYLDQAAVLTVSGRDWVSAGEVMPADTVETARERLAQIPQLRCVRTFDDACASFGENDAERRSLALGCARRGRREAARAFAARIEHAAFRSQTEVLLDRALDAKGQ